VSFQQINLLHVMYGGHSHNIPLGRLALKNRKIFFEYDSSFLELGLELSPFKLPLQRGAHACDDQIFDGLFGVFNDSLPDGWGRSLLDRKLRKMHINPVSLTPLDRLSYVGSRGMGALIYQPEIAEASAAIENDDLDRIADECFQFQEHDDDGHIDELLALNGSSAGARPKVLMGPWIIKFRSFVDPKDIGPLEYAYHLMAVEAGLDVPEAKIFKSKKCPGYFGVKRFDRVNGKSIHMHTLSGLLQIDHQVPSLDYEMLMKATLWLTKDVRECERQFRNAVFNVLAHNRDDHAKNFSFLMDESGTWRVSPAYDLTFSGGPGGEHFMTVMGEGRDIKKSHLLKLAEVVSIKAKDAAEIIDRVCDAVARWRDFAGEAGVSRASSKNVKVTLEDFLSRF